MHRFSAAMERPSPEMSVGRQERPREFTAVIVREGDCCWLLLWEAFGVVLKAALRP